LGADLFEHALRFLAVRSHSSAELRRKLVRHGPPELVESVLEDLRRKRYLDDESFAFERAMANRLRKRWGKVRLAGDLRRLGIDGRIIGPVLARVEQEAPELESLDKAILTQVARKGPPASPSQVKSLFGHCVRLGYSPEEVRRRLAPYFSTLDWDAE
jgi:SOS response regulatory protein OraA/RecX